MAPRQVKEVGSALQALFLATLTFFVLVVADSYWAHYSASSNLGTPQAGFFEMENLRLYDIFFRWRAASPGYLSRDALYRSRHPGDNIVILYLDKSTLATARKKFHADFPWPRSLYVPIVRELKHAGARAIGFDILFTGRSEGDGGMASALRSSRSVLAFSYIVKGRNVQGYDAPAFPGSQGVHWGFVNVSPDQDGVLRRTLLFLQTRFVAEPWSFDGQVLKEAGWEPGKGLPTDSVYLMERKKGAPFGTFYPKNLEIVQAGGLEINFSAPNHFESYPLRDFWNGSKKTIADAARGSIVLIGADALSAPEEFESDAFQTPVGDMNGVEVHANVLSSLLERNFLRDESGLGVLTGSLLVLLFLFAAVLPATQGWLRFLAGSGIVAAEFLLGYWLFRQYSIRLPLFQSLTGSLLDFGAVSFYFHLLTRREMNFIRGLFEGYLSPAVVKTLIEAENKSKLEKQLAVGEKVTVTVLYADIRGFTSLSEYLGPDEVVRMLNEYLPRMALIVYQHGGYLDKFIGDALMAVFTAPFPTEDDPWRALQTAMEMQKVVRELCVEWEKEGRETFEIGIGINTGEVVLGNIGSEHKKDYTVIGDPVNVASRLCGRAGKGEILISEATWVHVRDRIRVKNLGPVSVKGKAAPVQVYAVEGGI